MLALIARQRENVSTVAGVRSRAMGYYDGDAWSNHVLNEVKCAECEEYFDDQEGEGKEQNGETEMKKKKKILIK